MSKHHRNHHQAWNPDEHELLFDALELYPRGPWSSIDALGRRRRMHEYALPGFVLTVVVSLVALAWLRPAHAMARRSYHFTTATNTELEILPTTSSRPNTELITSLVVAQTASLPPVVAPLDEPAFPRMSRARSSEASHQPLAAPQWRQERKRPKEQSTLRSDED